MKNTKFENTLALAGALLVLIGVSAAATSALADDNSSTDSVVAVVAAVNDIDQVITESASEAAAQATDDAIIAMNLDNQLDLDIRLLDRTSLTATDK
jgi:hypothetical protein